MMSDTDAFQLDPEAVARERERRAALVESAQRVVDQMKMATTWIGIGWPLRRKAGERRPERCC